MIEARNTFEKNPNTVIRNTAPMPRLIEVWYAIGANRCAMIHSKPPHATYVTIVIPKGGISGLGLVLPIATE